VLAIRVRSGADVTTENTEMAAQVVCGPAASEVAETARKAMQDLPGDGKVPTYEVFRQRIRSHFE